MHDEHLSRDMLNFSHMQALCTSYYLTFNLLRIVLPFLFLLSSKKVSENFIPCGNDYDTSNFEHEIRILTLFGKFKQ